MRVYLVALAASVPAALTAGAWAQEAATTVQRDLTVTGPRGGLERFVALQNSRRPPLAVSRITPLDNGRATAVVTFPADRSGNQLVQTAREALAAGLSYEYADAPSIRTRRR